MKLILTVFKAVSIPNEYLLPGYTSDVGTMVEGAQHQQQQQQQQQQQELLEGAVQDADPPPSTSEMNHNDERYVSTSAAFPTNFTIHDGTSLGGGKMAGVLAAGSNTRLTYSLTPSLDTGMSETNARIINPLHTVLSGKSSQLDSMVEGPLGGLQSTGSLDFMAVAHENNGEASTDGNNELTYVMDANSQFQSGIEFCRAALSSNLISTDSYPGMQTTTLLPATHHNSLDTAQSVNGLHPTTVNGDDTHTDTTTDDVASLTAGATTSPLSDHSAYETPPSDTLNTLQQEQLYTTTDRETNDVAFYPPPHTSLENTPLDTKPLSPITSSTLEHNGTFSDDEPTCKKQRIDSTAMPLDGTELPLSATTTVSLVATTISTHEETSADTDISPESVSLVSSQTNVSSTDTSVARQQQQQTNASSNDTSIVRPNTLDTIRESTKSVASTVSSNNSGLENLETDVTTTVTQGDQATTGKKKVSAGQIDIEFF